MGQVIDARGALGTCGQSLKLDFRERLAIGPVSLTFGVLLCEEKDLSMGLRRTVD
jgi:hypothetical protein